MATNVVQIDADAIMARLDRIESGMYAGRGNALSVIARAVGEMFRASHIDGVLAPGDVTITIIYTGGIFLLSKGVGAGVEIGASDVANWSSFPFSDLASAIGLIVGCGTGILRLWRDLTWRAGETVEKTTIERPPPMGLDVHVRVGKTDYLGHVLEDHPRSAAAALIRKVAVDVFGRGHNFSRRQAGRHLGDHFSAVQEELVRCRVLEMRGSGKNAGYTLTSEGEQWLRGFINAPLPR